jgi:hypothetical protein
MMISFGYDTSPKAITCEPSRVARFDCTFSFIRTLTVGPGISPDLLDPLTTEALAGLPNTCAYRRWGISPRPENKTVIRQSRAHLQAIQWKSASSAKRMVASLANPQNLARAHSHPPSVASD